MTEEVLEVGGLEVGSTRWPRLSRESKHMVRMRRIGGDSWVGCACPTVLDQNGRVMGVLTICAPDGAGGVSCATTPSSSTAPAGECALLGALQTMLAEGWSEVEIADFQGEPCARLDLSSLADPLRAGILPHEIRVHELPKSHVSRRRRIAIAMVAAPLLVASGVFALAPAFGTLLPFAPLVIPLLVLALPTVGRALRGLRSRRPRGFVTEVPVTEERVAAGALDGGDPREEEREARAEVTRVPVRLRVRVSSLPPPSGSGVFRAPDREQPVDAAEHVEEELEERRLSKEREG